MSQLERDLQRSVDALEAVAHLTHRAKPAKAKLQRHLPVITNSEIKTFRRCERLHFYTYVLGYRPRSRAAELRFGTLVHAALEAWWKTAGSLPAALEAIASGNADPLERVRARVLVTGYHHRWEAEPITVIGVEQEFRVPIVHPDTGATSLAYELAGKFDALCQLGRHTYIPEHKTSSEDITDGSPYWVSLRLDSQVSTYMLAGRALGLDVRGVLYDVLGKPGLEPKSATPIERRKYTKQGKLYAAQRDADESLDEFEDRLRDEIGDKPEHYYRRAEIVRTDGELREAALDIWNAAERIHAARVAHYHPKSTDACRAFGRLCSFFGVCDKTERLEEGTRFEKVENVHQELNHATSSETDRPAA